MPANSRFICTLPLLVAMAAVAEESPLPTVGDLSRVQAETIMYEAKSKRAAAKASMQENQMKAGDDPMAQSNSAPPVVASDLPTVTGVSGVSGRLVATFRYPNGGTASASSGTEIAGGFVVSEVSLNRVVLTKGDRRFPLQSGVVTQQPTQQQPLLPGQFPTLSQPPVAIPAQ